MQPGLCCEDILNPQVSASCSGSWDQLESFCILIDWVGSVGISEAPLRPNVALLGIAMELLIGTLEECK
jgi:hypothetical protein